MNTQLQLEQAYMQVAESTGVNEAIPLAKIGRGAMSAMRFVGKHGKDVITVANALIALVDAIKKDKDSSVKITDSIENAVEKAREIKAAKPESPQNVNEELEAYDTNGLTVKPYRDVDSWNTHGSFRNRPLIITKDTPDAWADDTAHAAEIAKDAILAMTPMSGGAAIGALGRGVQTAGRVLPTAAAKVIKPVGTAAAKVGSEVVKGGAKSVGGAAAVGGGGYLAAKKVGNDLKREITDFKDKVGVEVTKFKESPGKYVSDVGNKVLTNVKNAGDSVMSFAKSHPYATAAIAATPLLIYGGKKAYDYLKSKFGDSEDEGLKAAESCDESNIVVDESVFDGMIEKMENHGFSFEDAGGDSILFFKDGELYSFNSWQEVEDCIADLDAGHENIFEDAPTAAPANTAQQPQQNAQPNQQKPAATAAPATSAATNTTSQPQQPNQQTTQQPNQQTNQQTNQQKPAAASSTAAAPANTSQQPQQNAQPNQQKPVQTAAQPQQTTQSATAQPKTVQTTSESKAKEKIKVKDCTDFKSWKAKRQF